MTQTDFHLSLLVSVLGRLRGYLERVPGVGVFADLRFDWNRRGLKPSGPDVAVVRGLPAPRKEISEQVGGPSTPRPGGCVRTWRSRSSRPSTAACARRTWRKTSTSTPGRKDTEYLIFNPIRIGSKEPLKLLGYRLARGRRYTWIPPDPQGRILSRTTGLYFWSDPDARRIEIFDQVTGERLLTAEEAREAAERQAKEEKDAREAAERQAKEEKDARETAEDAREAAEAKVQEKDAALKAESAARQAAEEEAARLRALLRDQG